MELLRLALQRDGKGKSANLELNPLRYFMDHLERRNARVFESKIESVISMKYRCISFTFLGVTWLLQMIWMPC